MIGHIICRLIDCPPLIRQRISSDIVFQAWPCKGERVVRYRFTCPRCGVESQWDLPVRDLLGYRRRARRTLSAPSRAGGEE